ncbi:MAG: hypothetical protein N2749_00240 [Clostridia bacterium]|nr:hypothetical protein [Clostridia bacterium]
MYYDKCNQYDGGKIPPCSEFLGNVDTIIKDNRLIYRNENRIFYFISTSATKKNSGNKCSLGSSSTLTNLQVSLATFLIGLYINEIQIGNIEHKKENDIHFDKESNDFINKTLNQMPEVIVDYTPSLSIVVSNSNAILSLYTKTITITPLNYYILFMLNRMENNPGLFFGNNAFVTDDPINFCLASLEINFPFNS